MQALSKLSEKWRTGKVGTPTGDMQMHGALWAVNLCNNELDATMAKLQPVIEKLVEAGKAMRNRHVKLFQEREGVIPTTAKAWDAALAEWEAVNG